MDEVKNNGIPREDSPKDRAGISINSRSSNILILQDYPDHTICGDEKSLVLPTVLAIFLAA